MRSYHVVGAAAGVAAAASFLVVSGPAEWKRLVAAAIRYRARVGVPVTLVSS